MTELSGCLVVDLLSNDQFIDTLIFRVDSSWEKVAASMSLLYRMETGAKGILSRQSWSSRFEGVANNEDIEHTDVGDFIFDKVE